MNAQQVLLHELIKHSGQVSSRTTADQKQTLNIFKKLYPVLPVAELNAEWLDDFDNRMRSLGLSPNTVWKHHKNMRALMTRLHDNGKIRTNPYRKYKIKQLSAIKSYITDEEMDVLLNAKLEGRECTFRDLFCISYLTLLRVSDVMRIKSVAPYQTGGKTFIRVHTQKTGDLIVIPVGERLSMLLSRIKNATFDFQESDINPGLKKIFTELNITRIVEVVKYINYHGQVRKEFQAVPVCELVTMHWARRSGITSMVISGMPMHIVMRFSGHKTETALMAYIGIDQQQAAEEMYNHKHFL